MTSARDILDDVYVPALEDPVHGEPALGNGAVEGLALDELHRQEVDALGFFDQKTVTMPG